MHVLAFLFLNVKFNVCLISMCAYLYLNDGDMVWSEDSFVELILLLCGDPTQVDRHMLQVPLANLSAFLFPLTCIYGGVLSE